MNVTAMTYAKLMVLLKEGTRSISELAEEVGVHYETMKAYIRALHKEGVIHIHMWEDDARGANSIAIWMLGSAPDAKQRPKRSHYERQITYRAKKRALRMIGRMAA